jgi:hypothetical protein
MDWSGSPPTSASPYDVPALATDTGARSQAVECVLSAHSDVVTVVTAPHFYASSVDIAHLNVALAEETRLSQDKPVRAILAISNRVTTGHAKDIAAEYPVAIPAPLARLRSAACPVNASG